MTTPLRRFVKRTLPWTVPVYERIQAVLSGLAPLREFRTPYGFRLVGPGCDFTAHQASGTYERPEIDWAADLMRRRKIDAFIDAGANVGLYTMLALAHGIPTVAIEPQPRNVRAIRAGMKVNGFDCRIVAVALSDREGTATMFGLSSGSASLLKNWNTEISAIRRTVATATLDHLLQFQFEGQRLLIKLDLEGNEWPALLGARDTLSRTPRPAWMVEIVDFAFKGGVHPNRAEIFALFDRHGYVPRQISPANYVFTEVTG